MRRTAAMACALTLLLATSAARGGPGRYTLPLPDGSLPAGTITIKVVGNGMQDLKSGQPVAVHPAAPDDAAALKTAPTGADGRARFDGLAPGTTVVLVVKAGDQVHRSGPISVPQSGGVRMLLTLGESAGVPAAPSGPGAGGGAMPPGHPPVTEAEQTERGAAEIEAVAELPAGQVEVLVKKGSARTPLAGVEVRQVPPSGGSVAPAIKTDAAGRAQLQLGPRGGAITASHGGLVFRSKLITPPSSGGVRATFVVWDRSTDHTKLVLAPGTHWVSQVGERVVRFMQVMVLATRGDVIVDLGTAGLPLPLPHAAEDVELPKELKGILHHDAANHRLLLRAPIPPSGLTVRTYYTMPYSGDQLEFRQRVPLASPASLVALVNGDEVTLDGPSITGPAQRADGQAGARYTLAATSAGDEIAFTFSNLPHHDTDLRTAALVVVGLIVVWAVIAAAAGPRQAAKLRRRREELLEALARLRQGKGKGKGKKDAEPQDQQEQLLAELRELWDEPW